MLAYERITPIHNAVLMVIKSECEGRLGNSGDSGG